MEEKRCIKCGNIKDISEFHIDNSKKDGHKNVCKKCSSKKRFHVSKIDKNIKQSLRYCLKNDGPFQWSKILGFSKEELISHLKSQFKSGMTIENYGEVWCVTFHIPRRCYFFSSFRDNEFKKCWSLKNLKPEYKEECYKQKVIINLNEVQKYSLYDILPCGNISDIIE